MHLLSVVAVGALASLGVTLAVACAGNPPRPAVVAEVSIDAGDVDAAPPAPPPPPLYTRLGGTDGVAAIVDAFVADALADKRLTRAFVRTRKGPKLDHFKSTLCSELCGLTGGDCQDTGKSLADGHAWVKMSGGQFDAFVEDFKLALEEKQVATEDAQQVLDELGTLRDQMVTTRH